MTRKRPSAVFVPYEKLVSGLVVRVNDLPRFPESHQAVEFLHKRLDLAHRLLDWREEFDAASIDEYMAEIGENLPRLPELVRFVEKKNQ